MPDFCCLRCYKYLQARGYKHCPYEKKFLFLRVAFTGKKNNKRSCSKKESHKYKVRFFNWVYKGSQCKVVVPTPLYFIYNILEL